MATPRLKLLAPLYTKVNGKFQCKFCPNLYTYTRGLYGHDRVNHKQEWETIMGFDATPDNFSPNEQLYDEFAKLGIPRGMTMMGREYFLLDVYDESTFSPNLCFEILDISVLRGPVLTKRQRDSGTKIHTDPKLPTNLQLPVLVAYKTKGLPTGMELGHLPDRGNYTHTMETFKMTKLQSVFVPQNRQLNQNRYNDTEKMAKQLTRKAKVIVITGVAGRKQCHDNTSKLRIPQFWFKLLIVKDPVTPVYWYDAFVFPNEDCTEPLANYRKTIYELEEITDLNLCHNIRECMVQSDFESACESMDIDQAQEIEELKKANAELKKANVELKKANEELKKAN